MNRRQCREVAPRVSDGRAPGQAHTFSNEAAVFQNCTLEHFKSVYDRITLPLARLTIFAGANSSGKSTVIQSLLLTTQTVQNPVRSRSIVLNGHILKMGEFDDVLSHGAETKTISLGFSLAVPPEASFARGASYVGHNLQIQSVECEFSFSASASKEDGVGFRRLQPRLESSHIRVRGATDEQQDVDITLLRSHLPVGERLHSLRVAPESVTSQELSSLEYEAQAQTSLNSIRGYYPLPRSSRAVGASLLHFIPSMLSVVYDTVDHQQERVIQLLTAAASGPDYYYDTWSPSELSTEISADVLERLRPVVMPIIHEYVSESDAQRSLNMFGGGTSSSKLEKLDAKFTIEQLLSFVRSMPLRDRRQIVARFAERENDIRLAIRGHRPAHYDLAMVPLPPMLEGGVNITAQFFARYVKYLGPLRDEPKPVYPLAGGADPRDIGYRGEHTAAVLETYRNAAVTYLPPGSSGSVSRVPRNASLHEAVLDWLQYMGIADDVKTADLGKLGHDLKVSAGAGEIVHDLTHVGVGVSQVLPILVLALLADPGSTLIFEQPELHLHPRVQTRLADFFVSLATLDKQCLVETHSEYLINRLRFLAAVAEDDNVSLSTLLYFVERDKAHSHYRPIRINQFGVIDDWPSGFFDESEELAASILKAGAAKRRDRVKRSNG